ncbi:hypothetical protein JL720_12304 [Aureococcus anophagefferens]|nr:hypothetical protein JL720_12304 [Aureococcus anophagefferens]
MLCLAMALRAEAALYVLDPTDWAADLGEDLDWATANAPFVRLPGHPAIERVFYYRWRVVKKHIVPIDGGSVITEFLPRVPWAGAHNTIPAAAGHHIAETAWLADATVATNYSRWWFAGATRRTARPTARWWQNDDRDAMEVSISGAGCRPTIAAALYGDAAAVAAMAALDPRNDALVDEFAAYVNFSRASLERLWNENIASFAVLPCDAPPRRSREPTPTRLELRNAAPIVAADPCDLEAVRVPGEPVDVRELLAYAPFAFEGLVDETRDYEPMFAQLFDEAGFAAPFGLTTAERRHPCFNYSWAHGDTWNQESWPYETSRLLKGLADRLHAGRGTASLTAASYAALLTAYAEQHVNTTAVNDTGVPHVYGKRPPLGYWNNRERMYWTNNTEKDMGVHTTSTRRPPLLDPARGPFAVDGVVLLDNRTLSATWDEAAGFAVYVDGVVRNRSDTVVPLWVDLDCMIAATLMVMMPWEAPRRSGYDACVAPEDAALEAALRRSSRRGRATRRIGAGVACVLLLAVASSAARSRDGLRTREMDVVAPEGCGGAARFDVAARFTAGSAGAMTFKDGAAVKLAYYEKGARKEACDTHTIYVELQSDDAGLRRARSRLAPTSPDFRKFWTPEESKSAFVVGDGDRVEAWLRSFGAETARASDAFVRATGPAFVFEAAFGCELYRFDAPHRSVDRCDGGYAVHDDIFDEVRAVHGLAELPPVLRSKPRRVGARRRLDEADDVTPKTLANYYDVDTALDGAGATQSVFETDLETYSPGDLEAFEAEFDLRRSAVSDVGAHVSDEACAADADACSEANLDVQYITALAPGAERRWYLETVLDVFVQYAVDLDAAEDTPLVNSISYGSFERENAPDAMEAFNRAVMKLGLAGATASWADDDAGEVVCESDVDDAVITSGGGFSEFNAAPAYAGTTYAAYLNATDPDPGYAAAGRGYPDLALAGYGYEVVIGGELARSQARPAPRRPSRA